MLQHFGKHLSPTKKGVIFHQTKPRDHNKNEGKIEESELKAAQNSIDTMQVLSSPLTPRCTEHLMCERSSTDLIKTKQGGAGRGKSHV